MPPTPALVPEFRYSVASPRTLRDPVLPAVNFNQRILHSVARAHTVLSRRTIL